MATLAARDRENLINAHQTAAASKPLNQNARGVAPKTPFKARIYDENAPATLKGGAKDNIALKTIGKLKQAEFATPAPTNARNALAPKTTNAKAKTPGFGLGEKQGYTIRRRSGNRPPSVRKIQPQSEETTTSKLKIPFDQDNEDAWPEIEYMPPRGVPLPDHDEDLVCPPDILETIRNYDMRNFLRDAVISQYHEPDDHGVTQAEKDRQEREETERIIEQREDAEILRNSELAMVFCDCDGACDPADCPERIPQRAEINARYKAAVADPLTPRERRLKEQQERANKAAKPEAPPAKTKTAKTVASDPKTKTRTVTTTTTTKIKVKMDPDESTSKPASHSRANSRTTSRSSSRAGPSDAASRRAASALSMRSDHGEPSKKPSAGAGVEKPTKTRNYPKPWLAGSKLASKDANTDAAADTNYAGRHAAAAAASRTNLGFSKGRSVSAGLRKVPGASTKEKRADGKEVEAEAVGPRKRITEAQWLEEMWRDLDRRKEEADRKQLGFDHMEPIDIDPMGDFELKLEFEDEDEDEDEDE